MSGKLWYNNGVKEIQIDTSKGDTIPDGYVRGRKKLSPEEILQRSKKHNLTMSLKSEQELADIKRRRSDSLSNSYKNKSDEEKQSIIDKRRATMDSKSDEWKVSYKHKISDSTTGKNKGKIPWNKGLTKEQDDRLMKLSNSCRQGMLNHIEQQRFDNPDFYTDWRSSINDVMRSNGTFNKSVPEDKYYQKLLSIYGNDNVVRYYTDNRYPFACDFYIPSEDLFIEYNGTWTHGGHPFDETNLDDIYQLETWQEKAKTSNYYKNAIYTWTDLDVRKKNIAEKNDLNIKFIY